MGDSYIFTQQTYIGNDGAGGMDGRIPGSIQPYIGCVGGGGGMLSLFVGRFERFDSQYAPRAVYDVRFGIYRNFHTLPIGGICLALCGYRTCI